jgi:hypothetical protein
MKNIHVLKTDKPSRLIKSKINDTIVLEPINVTNDTRFWEYLNIYITSDEEIKAGDWFISLYSNSIQRELILDWTLNKDAYKKIILTTDKNLIADGVQSIPDEFLEWFVKNPSCEEVKFKEIKDTDGKVVSYRFISALIPKEEPKQETLEEFIKEVLQDEFFTNISEHKKAERLIEIGAKWQQERMYSEEEVLDLLYKRDLYLLNRDEEIDLELPSEWFEKFKNK